MRGAAWFLFIVSVLGLVASIISLKTTIDSTGVCGLISAIFLIIMTGPFYLFKRKEEEANNKKDKNERADNLSMTEQEHINTEKISEKENAVQRPTNSLMKESAPTSKKETAFQPAKKKKFDPSKVITKE